MLVVLLALVMVISLASPVLAGEDLKISLDDAIKMALDSSKSLKVSENQIETQKITNEDIRTNVKYTPTGPGYGSSDKPVFQKYYSAEYQLKLYKKQLENSKRQVLIDTKKAYYSCLVLEQKKDAQDKTVALNALKLAQETARYNVGMGTEYSVSAAQSLLATEKASLEDINVKLDKAYSDLNNLLGLDQGARPVLTSQVAAEFARLGDVDTEVSRAMDGSLEVWTAAESYKLADQLVMFEDKYKMGEYKEEKASLEKQITEDSVRVQFRELCNSINYMVEKSSQLAAQKKELDESYRVQKLNYDLGMVTKDVVLNLESKRLSLVAGISELASQYVSSRDTLAKYQGKLDLPATQE